MTPPHFPVEKFEALQRDWGCQLAKTPSSIYQSFDIDQKKLETNQSDIQGVCISDTLQNSDDDDMEHEPEILNQRHGLSLMNNFFLRPRQSTPVYS